MTTDKQHSISMQLSTAQATTHVPQGMLVVYSQSSG